MGDRGCGAGRTAEHLPNSLPAQPHGTTLPQVNALAAHCLDALAARGATLATAESLTGGLLAAELVTVPGASRTFVGGVVAYSPAMKHAVLEVAPPLIAESTVVSREVALAMAGGVRKVTGAQWGVATTGEAGPESSTGHPVGTVWVACVSPDGEWAAQARCEGNREDVRRAAVELALASLASAVDEALGSWP